jgi:hypothetical protein
MAMLSRFGRGGAVGIAARVSFAFPLPSSVMVRMLNGMADGGAGVVPGTPPGPRMRRTHDDSASSLRRRPIGSRLPTTRVDRADIDRRRDEAERLAR